MYTREAAKVASSRKSGAGTDDIYVPRLSWFEVADRFLKPVAEGRPSKTNMIDVRESDASFFDDEPSGSQTSSQAKKAKRTTQAKHRSQEVQPILEAVTKLQNISHTKQPDEFEVFGSHVANQLRNMPLEEAISSQAFISNYLSQRRLKILRATAMGSFRPESSESGKYSIYSAQSSSVIPDVYEDDSFIDDSFFIQDTVEVETVEQQDDEYF
ncbi:uncharacterized protein LOC118740422 isoform X2 [Rhagoletis pomonella]|uniref:uncharacterized protein LOC118740422 isoform X2 n=1 Tax=Rhagoletis pomonella TaxID=28610 RepID=UPI001782C0B4|nr:uncharacterized protein LOC118740422 isoform X2 [Rhagoletis pomonella]